MMDKLCTILLNHCNHLLCSFLQVVEFFEVRFLYKLLDHLHTCMGSTSYTVFWTLPRPPAAIAPFQLAGGHPLYCRSRTARQSGNKGGQRLAHSLGINQPASCQRVKFPARSVLAGTRYSLFCHNFDKDKPYHWVGLNTW
jgi:hypothetical protein